MACFQIADTVKDIVKCNNIYSIDVVKQRKITALYTKHLEICEAIKNSSPAAIITGPMHWSYKSMYRFAFICIRDLLCQYHCKLLQLINKLQGKAVTHSEKLEWWIILIVKCVTILLYTSVKWLHISPLKYSIIQVFQNV